MAAHHNSYAPNAEGFRELFQQYLDPVHDYIRAITHSHYLAEETAQELFLKLWRKRSDWHLIKDFDHYIFRMARNMAINLLKKAALDQRLADELYKRASLQSANLSAADELNFRQINELVEQAVKNLPPQSKKVYLLSRKEHMDFDQIAETLNLSRNTVRNHLNRALSDIRNHLVNNGFALSTAIFLAIISTG